MSDLGKWPRLLVAGEPITPEQADEVIVRTTVIGYLDCNDQGWNTQVREVLGLPPKQRHGENWREELAAENRVHDELHCLNLSYLYNSRIASAWIGGPHGWVDWDGRIGCSTFNIGKWPSADEVTDEWALIAKAFPFLDLTAQFVTDEGEGELVGDWRVKDGTVVFTDEPGPQVADVAEIEGFPVFLPGGERGVELERLRAAVARARDGAR